MKTSQRSSEVEFFPSFFERNISLKKIILTLTDLQHAGLTVFFFIFYVTNIFSTTFSNIHMINNKNIFSLLMYSRLLVYQGVPSSCKTTSLMNLILTFSFSAIVLMSRCSSMNFPGKPWSLLFFKQRKSSKKLTRIVGQ